MIELQDKLRPTQPFFVLDTDRFYQEVFARQGISHFYTFRCKGNTNLRIVPDGCIDLIFGYGLDQMTSVPTGKGVESMRFDTEQNLIDTTRNDGGDLDKIRVEVI